MFEIKKDISAIDDEDGIELKIKNLRKNTDKFKEISHYTTFDNLEKIITNKEILLNRIDKVNDLNESIESRDYYRVFVSCFTVEKNESVPHWVMYGKNDTGVRITYKFKKNKNISNFINYDEGIKANFDSNKCNTIIYDNHIELKHISENFNYRHLTLQIFPSIILYDDKNLNLQEMDNFFIHNRAAFHKKIAWKFEKEIRLIGIIRLLKVEPVKINIIPNYFLANLNFNSFNIKITLNPWANDDLYCKIKKLFNDNNIDVEITDSILKNSIVKSIIE